MWDKLKEILKASGGKAVIVEDGDPKYIVIPVDEYLKLTGGVNSVAQPALGGEEKTTPSPFGSSETSAQSSPAQPAPANDNESIFLGAIDPSRSDAPVDLSDIDTADTPSLADYNGYSSDIDLSDLPL
ncbi:MAG: hypothetical protein WDZ40_00410 [Candidatus Spechtbacterales bacterium]